MEKYNIVDNEGNVYAQDISTQEEAKLILNDTIEELKEKLSEKEIETLELEII